MKVAQIILNQIKMLDRYALMAWGIKSKKDVVYMNDGLKLKTSGSVRWKGYVYVKYDEGYDLYNIVFFRIRKCEIIVDKEVEGVYVEDLVRIINEQVG